MVEPSRFIKILAAFVAGVVVALGSALIYVRVSESVHPPPVAPTVPVVRTAPPAEPPVQASDQDVPDTTVVPQATAAPPQATPAVRKSRAKTRPIIAAVTRPAVHLQPPPPTAPAVVPRVDIAVAVNKDAPPPVLPAAQTPAPGRAVNEDSQSASPQPQLQTQSFPSVQQQYSPAPDPLRQPHVVTLQAGTALNVRLLETLSTDHNYTGDAFRATLESPIIVDGFIIADKGSKVLGRIVNAQKAGRVEGISDLSLALTEINTTDGQRVSIETSTFDKKGQTSVGEDTAKIAGGAAVGAIIGAIAGGGKGAAIGAGAGGAAGTGTVLVTRGKPTVIANETRLSFRLTSPVTVTEKLNY